MLEVQQRNLIELEGQRPELSAWLRPLRVSLTALGDDAWRSIVPLCAPSRLPAVPVLHEAILPLDADVASQHVRSVLCAALGMSVRQQVDSIDAAILLEAAIAQDDELLAGIASDVGFAASALSAAAQLAAVPLLIACARAVASQPLTGWTHSYCHVCGALPISSEVLGLERKRHLRCGRCGASWKTEVLLCAFCQERDHAKLSALVPEGDLGQVCWVETCNTCRGYIKARAMLRGANAEVLLLEDARTIELDLLAAERGYSRPLEGHFATRLQLRLTTTVVS